MISTFINPIQALDHEYDVINQAAGTPGGDRFDNEIGIPFTKQTLKDATEFIWQTFKQNNGNGGRNYAGITVVISNLYNGPASYASNNIIFINSNYIQAYQGDVRIEVIGIIYHQATHVWQWTGNGRIPQGLFTGIADYVRLKADYAPKHWAKRGSGSNWDQGFEITAYFLDYCEDLSDGFVGDLNALMKDSYSDDFFVQLLGKSVDQLWNDYKSQ
ncbi:Basic secretory protein [Quillaja saponaria]|uniref:Basic secretory protein n=1 Tax=Quillaja saponaria TaxID=32244 RepID=A0AAD7PTP1_QUISA|nr:Basic secretory protein [Quillaja saponaria]